MGNTAELLAFSPDIHAGYAKRLAMGRRALNPRAAASDPAVCERLIYDEVVAALTEVNSSGIGSGRDDDHD